MLSGHLYSFLGEMSIQASPLPFKKIFGKSSLHILGNRLLPDT